MFRRPWAKSEEFEDRHQKLYEEIGTSLRDLGYVGYILLYGTMLYNVDEDTLSQWDIPQRDKNTILRVCAIISYKRQS